MYIFVRRYLYTIIGAFIGIFISLLEWFGFNQGILLWDIATVLMLMLFGYFIDERTHRIVLDSRLDGLTQLYNAQHFWYQIHEKKKQSFSLLMIDIDYFKQYNDTYGHLAGNHMLVDIGGLIQKYFNDYGTGYRFGGEEFMVILPNISNEDALNLAIEFRKELRNHPKMNTVSMGLVSACKGTKDVAELFRVCDVSLYKAKEKRDSIFNGGQYQHGEVGNNHDI